MLIQGLNIILRNLHFGLFFTFGRKRFNDFGFIYIPVIITLNKWWMMGDLLKCSSVKVFKCSSVQVLEC